MSAATASKQEDTYALLRARIVDGTYAPGHRLVIDALAREFAVSQMPVREAIRRLEAEGWVTYERHRGAHVAPIDARSWTETMTTLAVMEGYATALAAPGLRESGIDDLRTINDEMTLALEAFDVLAFSERNLAFHGVIYDACPNEHLRRELEANQERLNTLRRSIFAYIPARGATSIAEHAELIALMDRDEDPMRIELAAREHKLHTVAAYQERIAAQEDRS